MAILRCGSLAHKTAKVSQTILQKVTPKKSNGNMTKVASVGVPLILLTSCIPGSESFVSDPAGLAHGLFHGFIAPINLFISGHNIFEVHNTGFSYGAGFIVGVSTTMKISEAILETILGLSKKLYSRRHNILKILKKRISITLK